MTTSTSDRHMIASRNQRRSWIDGCSSSGTGGAGRDSIAALLCESVISGTSSRQRLAVEFTIPLVRVSSVVLRPTKLSPHEGNDAPVRPATKGFVDATYRRQP